jgi:hypothetical protein
LSSTGSSHAIYLFFLLHSASVLFSTYLCVWFLVLWVAVGDYSPLSPSLISESVAYEFRGKGGVITYSYPEDKKPDTKVSGEKN